MGAPQIVGLALVPYAVWLVLGYEYHFLDGVNLAFHEAGHVFFGLLGQTLGVLGGTLLQLAVPLACAGHFLVQGRLFEACVGAFWFGESLMYTAVYMGDAMDRVLPLVGGGEHDWYWLLGRAGLLAWCKPLALVTHLLASAVVIGALGAALMLAFRRGPANLVRS